MAFLVTRSQPRHLQETQPLAFHLLPSGREVLLNNAIDISNTIINTQSEKTSFGRVVFIPVVQIQRH